MPETKQMEVRAVKLIRSKSHEGCYVPELTLHDPELKADKFVENCQNLCHTDFVRAVSRLNHHIAVLCDQTHPDDFENSEIVDEHIVARGYSLSGAEDELRIVIKGFRKTTRGGAFQINVPVLWLHREEEENEYTFLDDLKEKLKRITAEALAYVFEGKKYEDPQQSLNFPEEGKVTKAKIAEPITPAGVVKEIVDDANGERVPQTAKHKSGRKK